MFVNSLLRLTGGTTSLLIRQRRCASLVSALNSSPVVVSNDKDVYTNLALEHWFYTNLKFEHSSSKTHPPSEQIKNDQQAFKGPIIFIWTDEPSLIIGRHQNPWVESTLGFVNKAGIKLARRHSGGGCVYHDENNINISIIGGRELFENRQENLKFLASILKDKYDVECEPSKRHDLIHLESGLKMSGSAAKLGRSNCYHHFTLLVDTNKEAMETAIRQTQQDFIHTNSSLSHRSKTINLRELKPDLSTDQVISDLAVAYGNRYKTGSKQESRKSNIAGNSEDNVSLRAYKKELESWDWIHGRTPKFKLQKQVRIIDEGIEKQISFIVTVNRGKFDRFELEGSELSKGNDQLIGKFDFLIGTNFSYTDAMVNVVKMVHLDESALINSIGSIGSEQIFATYLLQMIQEANF